MRGVLVCGMDARPLETAMHRPVVTALVTRPDIARHWLDTLSRRLDGPFHLHLFFTFSGIRHANELTRQALTPGGPARLGQRVVCAYSHARQQPAVALDGELGFVMGGLANLAELISTSATTLCLPRLHWTALEGPGRRRIALLPPAADDWQADSELESLRIATGLAGLNHHLRLYGLGPERSQVPPSQAAPYREALQVLGADWAQGGHPDDAREDGAQVILEV
ncbi:MAG: hypothetical protein H7831_08540 [Magnetococcus sp. WYHC-3]